MLITGRSLQLITRGLQARGGGVLCGGLWAWKSGLGSLPGHRISSDPGHEILGWGAGMTLHNEGLVGERKPQGKQGREGLAWLNHGGRR